MGELIDITGKSFGRWEVLGLDYTDRKHSYWKCRCKDCGREYTLTRQNLVRDNVGYCPCMLKDGEKANFAYIKRDINEYVRNHPHCTLKEIADALPFYSKQEVKGAVQKLTGRSLVREVQFHTSLPNKYSIKGI